MRLVHLQCAASLASPLHPGLLGIAAFAVFHKKKGED
jgi:hypothetical protein